MQKYAVIFVVLLLAGPSIPASAQSYGVMMFDAELGGELPGLNSGAFNVAVGPAPSGLKSNYVPFDHYAWLFHGGFGLYNGAFPGFKLGITCSGGAFFDPYMGVDVLVLGYPKKAQTDTSLFDDAPDEDFYVFGLIPQVGIRINYPATDQMAAFASVSWAFPMTVATYGSAASLTTNFGLGVTLYQ